MASNEDNDATYHITKESLTTKHTSDVLQRTQTTAHIQHRLGTEQAPAQNQGSPAPDNSNSTSSGSSSGQGSSESTE